MTKERIKFYMIKCKNGTQTFTENILEAFYIYLSDLDEPYVESKNTKLYGYGILAENSLDEIHHNMILEMTGNPELFLSFVDIWKKFTEVYEK